MKTMGLKTGDKVEVLKKQDLLIGSWSTAEIIFGNGKTYKIRYDSFPIGQEVAERRVSRNSIRPCPPPVKEPNNWVPGDLAEVYHDFCWKQATVVKLDDNDNYMVRPLGSALDIMVDQSHLRMPQVWQNGKWIIVRKNLHVSDSNTGDHQMGAKIELDVLKTKDEKTQMLPTLLKRKLSVDSSNPKELQVYVRRRKVARNVGGGDEDVISRTSNHIHLGSCASSVCSNGYIGNIGQLPIISRPHPIMNIADEDYLSDAESPIGVGFEEESHSFFIDEEQRARIHRIELHIYRSFINILHASGPLSWEDEVELSNIRFSLRISNDEHLIMLRGRARGFDRHYLPRLHSLGEVYIYVDCIIRLPYS